MNYPIWDLPAAGLLIAVVAIVHVFISHFAVGGGLFLVVAERKARREGDAAFLEWLKGHSRFFAVLTLVAGAVTGVGIWFTIALVSPQATSSLINTFVWGWAIEWTFFVTEICAAMVYYYGWTRLDARTHMIVGWIYFVSAWMSLVVINGILTYMLTPGAWLQTRGFWDGFFNPTYLPGVVARTACAMGLAGLYAIFMVARERDLSLKATIARWCGTRWVLPMAVLLPVSLTWYVAAAAGAGVPVGQILGASGDGVAALVGAAFWGGSGSGHPIAQIGARATFFASLLAVLVAVLIATRMRQTYGRVMATLLLLLGFVAMGGAEWVREDLRKPYVIGDYMFVNSIRLPIPDGTPGPDEGAAAAEVERAATRDPFAVTALNEHGVLATALWTTAPEGFTSADGVADGTEPVEAVHILGAAGEEIFRLECFTCHTIDGHLGIRPLVDGRSVAALEGTLGRLALPTDANGVAADWATPGLRLATLRDRRMPPFVGTDAEKHALAVWLAALGGVEITTLVEEEAAGAAASLGATYYDEECSFCHGPDEDWPLEQLLSGKERRVDDYFDLIGRLPEVNDLMIEFEGTEEQRRALAAFLFGLQEGSR